MNVDMAHANACGYQISAASRPLRHIRTSTAYGVSLSSCPRSPAPVVFPPYKSALPLSPGATLCFVPLTLGCAAVRVLRTRTRASERDFSSSTRIFTVTSVPSSPCQTFPSYRPSFEHRGVHRYPRSLCRYPSPTRPAPLFFQFGTS